MIINVYNIISNVFFLCNIFFKHDNIIYNLFHYAIYNITSFNIGQFDIIQYIYIWVI